MTSRDSIGLGSGGYPRPDVPRLSLAERDRRWAKVRSLMDRDGIDVVLAPSNTGSWDQGNGNGRYISTIGGNAAAVSVVFPRHGEVTAITGPVPAPEYWLQYQDWVRDIRPTFFGLTPVLLDRLRELGMERARIGVAGLSGVARAPDGLLSIGVYEALRSALPGADLVNATGLMYEARFVKSEEEIALLRRGTQIVEEAFDVLSREAKAGVAETAVYARMMAALLENGGEPNSLLLWAAGNPVPSTVGTLASRRPLAADDVIIVEADGKWGGYLGHASTTVWVGRTDDTDRRMAEVQFEATRRCWEAMKPGAILGDLVDVCASAAAGTGFGCQPIVHSRGTGLDAPVLVVRARDERTRAWVLEENSVFVVKPRVVTQDGSRTVMWGDTVVVTPTGAQRLGTRPAPAATIAAK